MIEQADVAAVEAGSASEAFLEFWSALQWQSWPEALSYYSPSLQESVGGEEVIEALKFQASLFRASKPEVRRELTRRRSTVVRYEVVQSGGESTLSSTTWRRENGNWVMVYDSNLDRALRGWAQSRRQQLTAPSAKEPSAEAVRAGIEASEAQSAYIAKLQSDAE